MDLSWLCFIFIALTTIPVVYYGIRSRLRYAQLIREAQARGAFTDITAPHNSSSFRRFALFAVIGWLGMTLSIAVFILQVVTKSPNYYKVTLATAIIFGVIGSVAGYLMQREIDHRL